MSGYSIFWSPSCCRGRKTIGASARPSLFIMFIPVMAKNVLLIKRKFLRWSSKDRPINMFHDRNCNFKGKFARNQRVIICFVSSTRGIYMQKSTRYLIIQYTCLLHVYYTLYDAKAILDWIIIHSKTNRPSRSHLVTTFNGWYKFWCEYGIQVEGEYLFIGSGSRCEKCLRGPMQGILRPRKFLK